MKKYIALAVGVAMCAGVAFAGTFHVPFVFDNEGMVTGGDGETWVKMKNTTTSAILITVHYYNPDGTQDDPTPNTVSIPGNSSYSYRPFAPDVEEPSDIGDKPAAPYVGTMQADFTGADSDMVGIIQYVVAGETTGYTGVGQ